MSLPPRKCSFCVESYKDVIIVIQPMQKSTQSLFFAVTLLFCVLAAGQTCPKGQTRRKSACIECKTLEHVDHNAVEYLKQDDYCPCIQGFSWSETLLRCEPVSTNIASIDQNREYQQDGQGQVQRLLQSCSSSLGYIAVSSACVNCRLFPYALGVVLSSTSCACSGSFKWYGGRCYCNYMNYIDGTTNTCNPCTSLPANLFASCKGCSAPLFISGRSRCVYCPSLANNGGTSSCCATGFKFNTMLHQCICNMAQGYAVGLNGVCSKCASGDSNCISCINSYVKNTIYCIHGLLVPNYNTSISKCIPGYTFKKDPYSGQIISCECDKSAGNYIGSSGCEPCATKAPPSLTSACTSCSLSSGFHASSIACFYCPGLSNTLGSPTADGCSCNKNYHWNANKGRCECDWSRGYVGGAISPCVSCEALSNTAVTVVPDACSCQAGYLWDPISLVCKCNTKAPSVFSQGNLCIDCSQLVGATGKLGADKVSCECINMYVWNIGTTKCECDSASNYVVFSNTYCTDCALGTQTTGLAYNGQCICQNNFVWDSSKSSCSCPSGYAVFGTKCNSCSVAAAGSSGAYTAAVCTACTATGWKKQDGVCVYCTAQSNNCNACPTGQKWVPTLGGCVCDWGQFYVTYLNSTTSPFFTCKLCPFKWGDGTCACDQSYLLLNKNFNICTRANTDVNADSSGICKSGLGWSESSYPFKCAPAFSGGSYLSNSATQSYLLCSSLSSQQAAFCKDCDPAGGFLLLPGINTCLDCATLGSTTATGKATISSCECKTGYTWNPITLKCVQTTCTNGKIFDPITLGCDLCDPTKSITINGACTPCSNDVNTNGFSASSASCACKTGFLWSSSANSCKSTTATCPTATNVIIGSVCFACPNTNFGTGTATNGACNCKDGYKWVFGTIDGRCICDASTSFQVTNSGTTTCYTCPVTTFTTGLTSGNTCECKNNYVWKQSSNDCVCDTTTSFVTKSGFCFKCTTTASPNFNGAATSSGCTCSNGYSFQATDNDASCVCNSPKVIQGTQCIGCPENVNTTTSFDQKGGCQCNNNYVWNAAKFTCLCDASVQAIILPDSTTCYQCAATNDPNFDGTVSNGKCGCKNGLSFVVTSTGANCTCDSTTNFITSDNKCSACPSNSFTTAVGDGNNGCVCLKNYIWDPSTKKCICDSTVSGIVLNNGTCYLCTADNNINFDGNMANGACSCINGFTATTTNNLPSCKCDKAFSTSTSCFDCPSPSKDPNSAGKTDAVGQCQCLNGYEWSSAQTLCVCDLVTSILVGGQCLKCGKQGTYTTTRRSSNACNCATVSGVTLSWSVGSLMCDCGSRKVIIPSGNSINCVTCQRNVNALSKFNSTVCNCISTFTWNPNTGRCDCGSNLVLFRSTCVACDDSRYAVSVSLDTSTCVCKNSDMVWDTLYGYCVCSDSSKAIFTVNNLISCKACGLETSSSSGKRVTPFSCRCPSGSVWQPNVGCICTGQDTILTVKSNKTVCITCNNLVYSSGVASNLRTCTCLGSLIWNSITAGCSCNSTSAIAVNEGVYSCVNCDANIFATTIRNITQCRCISSKLVWLPSGSCGCSDPVYQAIVGTGSRAYCVTCDASINSAGKLNATACACISDVLTFSSGYCDCGAGRAFIIQGATTFSCVNCTNPAGYVNGRKSANQCKCVSNKIQWDPSVGICNCLKLNMIVIGTGSLASCASCSGQYISPGNVSNLNTCSCLGTGLVFTVNKTTLSCRCPTSSIIKSDFSCLACPTGATVLTPFECKCPTGSIWNSQSYACKICGTDIQNSLASGGSSMACKCASGFIWDVMTLQCITPCNAGDSSCMKCSESVGSNDVDPAVNLDSSVVNTPTGSSTIKSAISQSYTNYASISQYMCVCQFGFKWDTGRLRCLDQRFI